MASTYRSKASFKRARCDSGLGDCMRSSRPSQNSLRSTSVSSDGSTADAPKSSAILHARRVSLCKALCRALLRFARLLQYSLQSLLHGFCTVLFLFFLPGVMILPRPPFDGRRGQVRRSWKVDRRRSLVARIVMCTAATAAARSARSCDPPLVARPLRGEKSGRSICSPTEGESWRGGLYVR